MQDADAENEAALAQPAHPDEDEDDEEERRFSRHGYARVSG